MDTNTRTPEQSFVDMINESLADTRHKLALNSGVYTIMHHRLNGAVTAHQSTSQLDVIMFVFTELGKVNA